jgi:hypothetical protein
VKKIKEREIARLSLLIYSTRKVLGRGFMYANYHTETETIGLTEYKPNEQGVFSYHINLDKGMPKDYEEKYLEWQKNRNNQEN